jgi:hypothetical protein
VFGFLTVLVSACYAHGAHGINAALRAGVDSIGLKFLSTDLWP